MYGKETLTYLKLWDSLQGKLVMAENVRQALTYVQDKNVEAGILFKTDALIGKNIKIIASARLIPINPSIFRQRLSKLPPSR
jgi:molybdate transport system substrate-binding protein